MTDEEEFAARSQLKWTREGDACVVGTSRVRELERRVRELERLLGRKTMEVKFSRKRSTSRG